MSARNLKYIHAMGHRALTPLYDPFVRLFMRERTVRQRMLDQVRLRPGERLLDVGSGTGTFAILAKQQHPEAEIFGIDGDPEIVSRATRKADAASARVCFQTALATELPFEARSFDRVTSSFVMHHLTSSHKTRACAEAFRVLRSGGAFYLLDFGPPHGRLGRAVAHLMHGLAELADNFDGRLPGMLAAAGFTDVREEEHLMTPFGVVIMLRGAKSV